MKLLVLGGAGMAGHVMYHYFKQIKQYTVFSTTRRGTDDSLFFDAKIESQLEQMLFSIKPDIVINCIGILNDQAAKHPLEAIQVNSLLPHKIVSILEKTGGKLIHISTDCVFSGEKGDYSEKDIPDGTSIYARTKILGEINSPNHLTIRTSIIGPELKEGIGLFQWFMAQKGKVIGYKKVYWNGVTTLELAKAVEIAIEQRISGLYHLTAPSKISKYELLHLFQNVFSKYDTEILPCDEFEIDRTLTCTRKDFTYNVPSYIEMLEELKGWISYRAD
ncbi:SDR family oxidoreductase [Fictibacillus enclensis]|uniref:dTDP-4-dehydrorhamnose reductase family protein n=1 Tax=Fictibacillus enclensis TaxID=1017270 RepID=UPI0025A0A7DD|nr:SDR family oxidoreductase [Fictibacillus enclensis]MDM5337856.1 SDR family oxidoreductase [Fictibacillus enclensis]